MKKYFDLMDDMEIPGRWLLGEPRSGDVEVDPRLFVRSGKPVQAPEGMVIPLLLPGNPLDWSLGESFMPVASEKAASILRELAPGDVQLVPVRVEGTERPFFIVNAWKVVACLDERRSIDVRKWGPEIHDAFIAAGVTGPYFDPVTPDD